MSCPPSALTITRGTLRAFRTSRDGTGRAKLARCHTIALAGMLGLAGCGGGGKLSIGWRFASGRDCANSSVATVLLDGPVACVCGDAGSACDCRFTCQDGEGGRTVEVTLTHHGAVTATGLSSDGNVLYRGSVE